MKPTTSTLDLNQATISKQADESQSCVILRTLANPCVCKLLITEASAELAKRWAYRVQNRVRWALALDTQNAVEHEASLDLGKLGISEKVLTELAEAGVVEVSIPFNNKEVFNIARELPWEYLISAATKAFRGLHPICVVRHLDVGNSNGSATKKHSRRAAKSFAMIETAPGSFREIKSFEAERALVIGSLENATPPLAPIDVPIDPTKEELVNAVIDPCPDILHITGIDAHRGHRKLTEESTDENLKPECEHDGIFVAGGEMLHASDFAKGINSGSSKPLFVGFNCWYSGSLLAPTCVAQGASASIGFQNSFDDMAAQKFYANFYRAWLSTKPENNENPDSKYGSKSSDGAYQDTLCAFLEAWESLMPEKEKIKGTGVILWSRHSLVSKDRPQGHIEPTRAGITVAKANFAEMQNERLKVAVRATPDEFNIGDLVGVKAKPVDRLNYSMLHNQRSLMDELTLWFKVPELKSNSNAGSHGKHLAKTQPTYVQDIEVEVLLMVGGDSFPFRTQVKLSHSNASINLADAELKPTMGNPAGGIQVPLISELARSVDERIQTSLYVNIQWHGQTLYRHTHTVSLTPTNEWSLTDEDFCSASGSGCWQNYRVSQ